MNLTLRKGSTRFQWLKGLNSLDDLWEKGLLPSDLKRHYFLTWFALTDGNILAATCEMGIHYNTFVLFQVEYGHSNRTVQLRRIWQKLSIGQKPTAFDNRLSKFYRKTYPRPSFTAEQNKALVELWKTGFPLKMVRAHFIFWGILSGRGREWLKKRLGFSTRHLILNLSRIVNPKRPECFWLSPLSPKMKEIYRPRYIKRIMSKR